MKRELAPYLIVQEVPVEQNITGGQGNYFLNNASKVFWVSCFSLVMLFACKKRKKSQKLERVLSKTLSACLSRQSL